MSGYSGTVLACLVLAVPHAATAQSVILQASGPSAASYTKGRTIAAGAKVTLAERDSLRMLDGGRVRVLTGPGTFTVGGAAADAGSRDKMKALLRSGRFSIGKRPSRIGAVRSSSVERLPPLAGTAPSARTRTDGPQDANLWAFDPRRNSRMCWASAVPLTVVRSSAATAESIEIRNEAGGRVGRVGFAAGHVEAPMPALLKGNGPEALTFVRGSSMAASAATITFMPVSLPPSAAEPEDAIAALAAQLIEKGCDRQLDLLTQADDLTPDEGPQETAARR